MSDWEGIAWWAGMAMGITALVVVVLALFRDPSRGRRRCPKCWYDMSRTSGMRCPECGRTQRKEKRFSRTRRRWRMAVGGVLLLLIGIGTISFPFFRDGKWVAYTPIPVLRLIISAFPEDTAAVRRRYDPGGSMRPYTRWEKLQLAYSLGESVIKEVDEADPYPKRYEWDDPIVLGVILIAQLGEEARPALPALADALDYAPAISTAARAHIRLGKLARPNLPALRNALVHADNATDRMNLLLALLVLGGGDEWLAEQATLLVNSTDDPQTKLDGVAALMIIGADAEDILAPLELVLTDGSPEDRVVCVRLLGLLARSREDGYFAIPTKMMIAPLLFRWGGMGHFHQTRRAIPAAADLVRAVADDEDPEVRRHAQSVLEKLP